MEIEDRFEIDIPINLVSDMTTVGDLVALVERQIRARGGALMDIFDKYAPVRPAARAAAGAGRRPVRRAHGRAAVADRGRRSTAGATILAGTNNYLGLTFDPACIAAAEEALRHYGTGTTGSRIANGTYGVHTELEPSSPASSAATHVHRVLHRLPGQSRHDRRPRRARAT